MTHNHYQVGLDRNAANFVALSPLSFIERSASVFPHHTAIIHGDIQYTWQETYARCRKLGSALQQAGIGVGDTVATMLPNTPAMFEAHFGVPMSGAVLNTLNTRLDPETIAFMLSHAGTKVLLTDREFSPTIKAALALLSHNLTVIDVDDPLFDGGECLGSISYEDFIAQGDADFAWQLPADEWDAITLNYTSGTTGNPKGVVYHHRGAYLNAIGNIVSWGMPPHAVYLWTLPMFHCNGWCFPWTVAANSGTNVCLRRVDPKKIFSLMQAHQVTHFCGAPIVHGLLINLPEHERALIEHKVSALIAGAAPPAAIIEGMERLGFSITHVYALTETYGPAAICEKHASCEQPPFGKRAQLNGRQGVRNHMQEAITVLDPDTLDPVPHDGETMGEIMFRGNIVMKGYLKNASATHEAFAGGWFHTGDLAVVDPDGYVKIKDRSKDVIISGGENISSIEVEDVLFRHPDVLAAAVVAQPDDKWGEVPCAFIEVRDGSAPSAADIIEHCRAHLARFKVPKQVIICDLPKTSTGKIQKFILRDQLNATASKE